MRLRLLIAGCEEHPLAENHAPYYDSIRAIDKRFKKRIAKAKAEDEPAIRTEWTQAKAEFWATYRFTSIEEVDAYYKPLLDAAQSPEDKSNVRIRWAERKADFYERLYKAADGGSPDASVAKAAMAEAEAIAAAHRQYGSPIGASGDMGRLYADPPRPIEAHWPTVEIIKEAEGK